MNDMKQINISEAEKQFYKLIKMLETKEEDEVIITRNGEPVAKIVLFEENSDKRIGISKGKYSPLNMDVFYSLDTEILDDLYME